MADNYQGRYSQAEFASLDNPELPERFQNYAIDKNQIGEGPVSYCYRAKRIDSNQTVLLKVFRKRICRLPGIRELHETLARVLSQYRGDSIVQFLGAGMQDGILFFEFEYAESVSLRSLIDTDAPFYPDLVVLIALGVISGLNQIHGLRPSPGMGNLIPLHRNLKPENILITPDGRVKIADIALLQIADFCDKAQLDLPYATRVYQSPEQLLRDGYADRRSDIYSLGLIMLEAATGRLPYPGESVFEVRQNVRENRRANFQSLSPPVTDATVRTLTKDLIGIIERMTAHVSEQRAQSLMEIEDLIAGYLKGSNYADPGRAIADFLRTRMFQSERSRKRGLIDRLFGG